MEYYVCVCVYLCARLCVRACVRGCVCARALSRDEISKQKMTDTVKSTSKQQNLQNMNYQKHDITVYIIITIII